MITGIPDNRIVIRPIECSGAREFDNENFLTYLSSWDGLRLAPEDPFSASIQKPPCSDFRNARSNGMFIYLFALKRFYADRHQEDRHEQHQN